MCVSLGALLLAVFKLVYGGDTPPPIFCWSLSIAVREREREGKGGGVSQIKTHVLKAFFVRVSVC